MYQVLLYIHVICAVIWVGGAVTLQGLALLVSRSDDPAEVPRMARYMDKLGTRLFLPAAVVLFVAGAWMTIDRWNFGQAWVAIAIALWIASALSGSLYLGPTAKRVAALFEAEGPTSQGARQLLGRIFIVSRLEVLSFAIVIAMMVFKPGH
jgi:uncharacterized membrane protein